MAKQSLFSPANSVLLQVLKTMWHRTKNRRRFELCFEVTFYSKDWQFHSSQICRHDAIIVAIGRCNPFEQLVDPIPNVFLLVTDRLMHSISILFVFCRDEKLSLFTTPLVLTRPRNFARALHITTYKYLCQFFIHVCRLDAYQYTSRWEHNPSV